MLNQRIFSDINRIGPNIWTGLPDYDWTGLLKEIFGLDCKNLRFVQHYGSHKRVYVLSSQ